jgi:hypothetical protein
MSKYWFKAKRTGWGISYPISREGWLVFIVLIVCIILEVYFTDTGSVKGIISLVLEIAVTVGIFLFVVKDKVKGGLKWRNGEDE